MVEAGGPEVIYPLRVASHDSTLLLRNRHVLHSRRRERINETASPISEQRYARGLAKFDDGSMEVPEAGEGRSQPSLAHKRYAI